jgi:cyclophilin family peptidyl-prolyl cis-trans isomerase
MKLLIKKLVYFVFLAAIFSNCAKPLADFQISSPSFTIPAKIDLSNQSLKAEEYEWQIGDSIFSKDFSPSYYFTSSGRHAITLQAKKGKKTSLLTKEIFLKAPEECLVLLTTSEGNILFRLYDNTLEHQKNFTKLIEEGFYKGILFHRVIEGFMIQAGDPQSKEAPAGKRLGSGDVGYTLTNEINKENFHLKGALAAARIGDQANPEKRSSGCQFYIVHGEPTSENVLQQYEQRLGLKYPESIKQKYLELGGSPQLDMNYTVFGEVIQGIEVVEKIATSKTDTNNRPTSDIKIIDWIILK